MTLPEGDNHSMREGITTAMLDGVDKSDVALSHRYRLSLPSKPRQSSFRVLALLFYENLTPDDAADETSTRPNRDGVPTLAPWMAHKTHDGRTYIVGMNDEGGYMGGSICAERAALVQLRFVPDHRITKVVIATDSIDPIPPGLLCREFLAGHPTVPWDVPVLSTGRACRNCSKTDADLFFHVDSDSHSDSHDRHNHGTSPCIDGSADHSIPALQTTIRQLYPFPSPYTRLTASESVRLGEAYSAGARAYQDLETLEEPDSKRLLELAIMEARSHVSDLHPIQFGAAVIFDDGTIVTSHQSCALEYGCTLDAVSLLASHLQEGPIPLLLVQADQFGIAHAPFAPARAYLTEHGYDSCPIVVHVVPTSNDDDDVWDIDRWTLREVFVSELAPHAPIWKEEKNGGNENVM